MSLLDDVKSKADIVSIISERVPLKKSGSNYSGMCPFHDNQNTPAFVVFQKTKTWYCFSGCGGGDILAFWMKSNSLGFMDALHSLAEKVGIKVQETRGRKSEIDNHTRLYEVLSISVKEYQRLLKIDEESLYYLGGRGISQDSIGYFGLGVSKDEWAHISTFLRGRSYTEDECVGAGVCVRGRRGIYDRFRNRIIFPIRDMRGRVVGLAGRATSDARDASKYINSPNSAIFNKSKLVYGLDTRSTMEIRKLDSVVVVEGYFDVIMAHQYGFYNVVSPMGTALTEDQISILLGMTRNITLAYDGDAGGRRSILGVIDTTVGASGTEQSILSDTGYIETALRMDANLSILSLPDGKDPDDIIFEGKWAQMLSASSVPFIDYMIGLCAEYKQNPNELHTFSSRIARMVESISSPITREKNYQALARQLGVGIGTVKGLVGGRRAQAVGGRVGASVGAVGEFTLIWGMLSNGEAVIAANQALKQANIHAISASDFDDALCSMIYKLIEDQLPLGADNLSLKVFNKMSLEECDLLDEHTASLPPQNPSADQITHAILIKRRSKLVDENASIGVIIGDTHPTNKKEAIERIAKNTRLIADIDKILGNRRT